MNSVRVIRRSLAFYWRTHVTTVVGVATGVAVLAGALLVGDSVRGTLRDLSAQRLGQTDLVAISSGFFGEALAVTMPGVPMIALPAVVTDQESGRRVGDVRVYGVDERFWRFHGVAARDFAQGEALVGNGLAAELGEVTGRTLLVRVQRPSDIPLESLHGRKEEIGRTLRFSAAGVVKPEELGEFSLEQRQSAIRVLFVPLNELQEALDVASLVNTLLVSTTESMPDLASLQAALRERATLADMGLKVAILPARNVVAVTSDAGVLTDTQATAAGGLSLGDVGSYPLLTYLANTIRSGDREIPYSLVTATELATVASAGTRVDNAIVLNEWAARELEAAVGDRVSLEYYLWDDGGQLLTRSADFNVAAVVPIEAGDRDMAPAYPGITDSATIIDWDPPFPLDLRRIQRRDEEYWNEYRTTPKAFIDFQTGRDLWRSRHGGVTSIRFSAKVGQPLETTRANVETRLRASLDPMAEGFVVRDVRTDSAVASRGATDFGAYFVYFSFFIVVSALLLAVLFFKLGVDQRAREIGLLRAVGFAPGELRRLFVAEGALLALVGGVLGTIGAIGYAALLVAALRTWWVDAVGTSALSVHVSPFSLAAAAASVFLIAVASIWWSLRALGRVSERDLLAGKTRPERDGGAFTQTRRTVLAGAALASGGIGLIVMSRAALLAPAAAFFGAGGALLGAAFCFFAAWFRRSGGQLAGPGWPSVGRLGIRNTTYRPARSVLSVAVIASATFILIAVDAFRRDTVAAPASRASGTGGYALFVETLLPIAHDPNTEEGRRTLNLATLETARLEPFRLLPGDDASCLNLYVPTRPRILAPPDGFAEQSRFVFQDSMATTDYERQNPWVMLDMRQPDGVIPVIADANSMTYVLHRKVGDTLVVSYGNRDITLRFVGALRDSIFQSELLMSQSNFKTLFPDQQGYQVFLVDDAAQPAADLAARLEDALTDFGADATPTAERLAAFHRVENTYLTTFQTLGGLGLLLGTVGLAAVMLRNVFERRRELALLAAVGYQHRHFVVMAAAETLLLLAGGLVVGALCAGIAIFPTVAERGGRVPMTAAGLLVVFAVFLAGLLSSLAATRVVARSPVLHSLRIE